MNITLDREAGRPLYTQLRDELRRRIESGDLPPGGQLPPVREMSRRCGLSFLTVTRALAELTREGLVEPRHGAGTFVRALAGSVAIELLLPGHAPRTVQMTSLYEQLFAGLRQAIEPRECRLWATYLDGKSPTVDELVAVARARRLNGLVVYHPVTEMFDALRAAAEQLTVVALAHVVPDSRVLCVQAEVAAPLAAMMRRRWEAGARAFAFFGLSKHANAVNPSPYAELYRTFLECAAELGVQPFIQIAPEELVDPHWNMGRVDGFVNQAAMQLPAGCVVVAQTAHIAQRAMEANAGFDIITYTEHHPTLERFQGRISFLYTGLREQAAAAARLVQARPGPEAPLVEEIPAQVIEAR